MSLRCELRRILSVLVPLSIITTVYLYLYPIFGGCAFPLPTPDPSNASSPASSTAFLETVRDHIGLTPNPTSRTNAASFRLLVLADPQIEGSSSLPKRNDGFSQRLAGHWKNITADDPDSNRLFRIQKHLRDIVVVDVPRSLWAVRKRLDLFGNDYYLAHIYRTLNWWTKPTHVTVLGDLIGSQWVSDDEFESRSWRYWNRVFDGGVRVEDDIAVTGSDAYHKDEKLVPLQWEDSSWSNRIINIAGNHDVGYAGDITEARMARFDREFGRANWDVRFEHPATNSSSSSSEALPGSPNPSLHLIVLNSLAFDSPALTPSVQSQTYDFLNDMITHRSRPVEDQTSFTLLLTHLPLHKQEGVCTDAPYFAFHAEDDEKYPENPRFLEGGLKEQNHLSDHLSHAGILQGVFGMSGDQNVPAGGRGRNGLILTGHDHTGCDVVHFVDRQKTGGEENNEEEQEGEGKEGEQSHSSRDWSWSARRYSPSSSSSSSTDTPSIREVTVRSMMGEFGGNAGLLSIWFDADPSVREWKYEITMCPLGVQHVWWAIHAVGAITLAILVVWIFLCFILWDDSIPGNQPRSSRFSKNRKASRKGSRKKETDKVRNDDKKVNFRQSQSTYGSLRRN